MKISFERNEFVKKRGLNDIPSLKKINFEDLISDEAVQLILDDIITKINDGDAKEE
ncbi:MAG: hypothetical protein MR357_01230 [Anaeroplasma sp.]|nr:hypothetical protein [Anaeroplasma sp.]